MARHDASQHQDNETIEKKLIHDGTISARNLSVTHHKLLEIKPMAPAIKPRTTPASAIRYFGCGKLARDPEIHSGQWRISKELDPSTKIDSSAAFLNH